MIMISLKFMLMIIASILVFTLYILLGIADFRPQKRQLLALIPLLLLLLTANRLDTKIPILLAEKQEVSKHAQTEIVVEEVKVTQHSISKEILPVEKEIVTLKDRKEIAPVEYIEEVKKQDIHSFKFINPLPATLLVTTLLFPSFAHLALQ